MVVAPAPASIDPSYASELLEVAQSILKRHNDPDIAQKVRAVEKAVSDLNVAVRSHLNAELEAVADFFGRYTIL